MRKLPLLIALILPVAASCSHRLYPMEESSDTASVSAVSETQARTDSIYIYETKYVREKGDTVYVEKERIEYRDRWSEKTVTDTVTIVAEKEVKVTEYVEKELTKWQSFLIGCGKAAVVLALAAIVLGILWLVHKLKK